MNIVIKICSIGNYCTFFETILFSPNFKLYFIPLLMWVGSLSFFPEIMVVIYFSDPCDFLTDTAGSCVVSVSKHKWSTRFEHCKPFIADD